MLVALTPEALSSLLTAVPPLAPEPPAMPVSPPVAVATTPGNLRVVISFVAVAVAAVSVTARLVPCHAHEVPFFLDLFFGGPLRVSNRLHSVAAAVSRDNVC